MTQRNCLGAPPRLLVASLALALAMVGNGAFAQVDKCQNESLKPQARIEACTALIKDAKQPADVRADALVNRGSAHEEEDRHDEAIADFTAALKLVPDDPSTLILRGNSYDAKGEKKLAIADYTEAIRLNPEDAAPYFNRGAVYQELGEKDKAIADYKKALAIDPNYESAQEGLAELTGKKQ